MRRTVKIVIWLTVLVVGGWFGYIFLGPNRHVVVPGKIYRCGQPSGSWLAKEIERDHIRTVLNLRGYCPDFDFYREEATAIANAGANLEDVTLSAKNLPSSGEVRRLVEIFDHVEYPILIHCKEGKDRTGLVAAMALLLYTDATLAQARRELWPIWGHFRVGRTVAMDDFLDRYERWLSQKSHTPALFREWATKQYIAGVGRSQFEWVDAKPTVVPLGTAPMWKVRVWNRSGDPWHLKPGSTAGVHLGYFLYAAGNTQATFEDKAGLVQKLIKPGLFFEATVALPPQRTPGRFVLKLSMLDYDGAGIGERAVPFTKYGDDPEIVEFEVR